ncbi:related to negative acting factor [Rhynchosporium agropyri]|uniref:Related to negative acting factor n=1 Tax=Rhynchosporium agropyri TaxID=914238 RepID=A0A1E1KGS9_9HELO|nr:related to negative acting factor [Rhynchosporium agropyri]
MSARQIQSIFPTLEERSAAVFGTMAPTWFQAFDFVGVLCRSENLEAHLQASINAVGLASLANASLAPEMMAKARWDYVKALRLTNEALRSPTSVKKDSTLFSVMVLSIYEMISGTNEVSLDSWAEHVKGAAALVRLRGPEQFKHPVGQRMFLQVTSNLLLNCIQRTIPMPQHFIELRKEAEKLIDTDSPAWRLSGVLIDFTIFRAKVKDCEIVGPRIVINQALELDQRLVDEFEDLPEEWMYEIVYTSENPHLVWNGNYHVYQEYLMSHIWNAMRTSRIMLHEVIRDQLLSDSTALIPHFTTGENANRLGTSTDVMLEMQADILASVPHHTPSLLNRNTSAVFDNSRSYFVLWPLFLAGSMDLATEPIRMWAAARLRDIGESMGIRQAVVISEVLMRRVTLKWDTKPVPQLMTCRKQVQARWAEEKPEDIHQARLPENSSLTYESERA